MAIVINSLTPLNPSTVVGGFITFVVDAEDTTVGTTLEYEWQFSSNGGLSYTATGLFNNTDPIFNTSPLSQNQTGLYYRVKITSRTGTTINEVVFSNEDPNIGDRIVIVEAAPSIAVFTEYQPSYTVAVADDVNLTVEVTVLNVDLTTLTAANTNLAPLIIQWQESTDNGLNWTPVVDNMPGATGNFKYDITETIFQANQDPSLYAKRSTLLLSEITFNSNLRQYRAVLSYSTASNTPTAIAPTVVSINPIISIFQQPGINANDTKVPVQCYKTAISGSGSLRVSVGAFTTAGQSLVYEWEYAIVDFDGNLSEWDTVDSGIVNNWFRYKTGTNGTSDVLQLERVIYFEQIAFRAVLSGASGETPVTSDAHYIYMKDVQVLPSGMGNKESLEDFYDPAVVPNSERFLYTQYPIRTVSFDSTLDVARNTGLNGQVFLQFQKQEPGASTWTDVGLVSTFTPGIDVYTPTPNNNIVPFDVSYTTPPVRIATDNQSKYRIKVTTTAIFTLSGGVKTLTPFYSSVSNLTVYRVVYITSQPVDSLGFVNQSASFAISAITTSPATITYKWQDAVSESGPWADIPGAVSSIYVINPVTNAITRTTFRCIVDANGTTPNSSPISLTAKLIVRRDLFTIFTSLNDYSVDQFQPVSWTVEAQSLSLEPPTYQWQKSTNYNPLNPSAAVWTNISGQTTDTYSIASVLTTDQAYYRCKVTSYGGEIAYTNAAFLSVGAVQIVITQNIPTTLTFLEGVENERTFSIREISTKGPQPTYQWQIKRVGESVFTDIGLGYNNQVDTNNNYTPKPFNPEFDNGAKIRCVLTAEEVPGSVFSNECTITVNRRFYYFADSSVKNVVSGTDLVLNLSPSTTGGEPSYQWQVSTNGGSTWSNILGETSSILTVVAVNSSMNNYRYRCQITLLFCTQYQYSRNNIVYVDSASSVGFTQQVQLVVVAQPSKPRYYTKEVQKSGAAIGTVICVPKPAGYINDPSATTDDIFSWAVSVSGSITQTNTTSLATTGSAIYNANKPSWVTDANYKAPKWSINNDRFPGFIELRGQWVLKSEFPLLYQVLGGAYGETTTLFRLPNPYGKKLMGTGNVNNNGGNISVIPLYEPDGNSGGDKNVAGSIGGVWNYSKSAQLPPGSPGVSGQPDGTAGTTNVETFSIGNFNTTGFTECEAVAETVFNGSFTFTVGPLFETPVTSVPPHAHTGISAGAVEGYPAFSGYCRGQGPISPNFYSVSSEGGNIDNGPEGVPESERGSPHSHGLSSTVVVSRNGGSNHNLTIGDTPASASVILSANLHTQTGSSLPSANIFLEPAPVRLTNSSRPIFNSSLNFYLRNSEDLPVNSNYFRLKYLIKAY